MKYRRLSKILLFGFLLCSIGSIEAAGGWKWTKSRSERELLELEREDQETEVFVSLAYLLWQSAKNCLSSNNNEEEFPRQYHGNMCSPACADDLQITREDYYRKPKEE